jgi:hypothetical protein
MPTISISVLLTRIRELLDHGFPATSGEIIECSAQRGEVPAAVRKVLPGGYCHVDIRGQQASDLSRAKNDERQEV